MQWAKNAIMKKICLLGVPVIIHGAKGTMETTAIMDPVHSVSEAARTADAVEDGYFPPGSYEYFGLTAGDLSEAKAISCLQNRYLIRRKELVQSGGKALYWWALLIPGGTDHDGA